MKKIQPYIFILIVLLVINCFNPFAPKLVDEITGGRDILTEQKSPEEVLTNFKYAYTFKDSLVYSDIIDSSYIFRTWDYNTSPPTPVEWNRDEELRVTGRMLKYFSSISLVWNQTTFVDSSIAENEIEIRKSFSLNFNEGAQLPAISGEVLFRFVEREDGKWYIKYWEDLNI